MDRVPRGDQVAAICPMIPRLPQIAAHGCAQPVAQRHANVLHDRVDPVAINHASGAAVAYALSSVEISNIAERPVPVVTAPQLKVPIQIEKLPSGEASELFRFATQMALRILERRHRVQHRKLAAQRFHRLKSGVQLLGCEVDERRVGAGEIGRGKRPQRIRECHRANRDPATVQATPDNPPAGSL